MSDTVSCAELDGQQVELLPARTVLSTIWPRVPIGDANGGGSSGGRGTLSSAMSMLGLAGSGHGTTGANADGGNS
ncbi:MAG: hypothetical protein WCC38_06610 [Pseudonocardiaceae bacterium]